MAISTCLVSGSIKTLLGAAVTDAIIKVGVSTPFFTLDGTLISGQLATTTTDSTGAFSVSVVRTTTLGKQISFEIDYNTGNGQRRNKKYFVYIPESATADFSDLVAQTIVPAASGTFPATNVTVDAITNLTATTAQAAFAEHQSDIDTLNTASGSAAAHIAASSGVHGVTGAVVGTTDTQTLTNKDITGTFTGPLTGDVTGTITGNITESQVTNLVSDLALKAPIASPTFTGTVTVPNGSALGTPTTLVGTNISGTAAALNIGGNAATATTSVSLSGSITESQVTNLVTDLAAKAPLASPTFTGTVTVPNGSALGTPTTLVGTNITGTASALNIGGNAATATTATTATTASTVTTNANLTGHVTSVGNAAVLGSFTSLQLKTALTDETGSGAAVFATSPTLVTPVLGVASATSLATTGNGISRTSTPTTATSYSASSITNTGGTSYIGQEGSTGGDIITGSSAYDFVMAPPVGHNLRIGYNGGAGVAATVDTSGNVTIPGTIVNPIHAGGTGAASTLTLESTTGAGTTDAIVFKTGSQVEAGRVLTNGKLRIGGTTTTDGYNLGTTLLTSVGAVTSVGYGAVPALIGSRSIGTEASPTAVTSGAGLLKIGAGGFDDTAWNTTAAQINFSAESGQTWTSAQHGSRITFSTTPLSSITVAERMRIDNAGFVGIGATAPRSKLNVTQTTNSGVPALGTANDGFTLGASGNLYGLNAGVDPSGFSWIQAMRFDGTATAYTLNLQPSGGAVLISGAATVNGQLIAKGTATNDSASTGYIGEYVESVQSIFVSTNMPSTATWGDLASISLTAGDWDLTSIATLFINGATMTYAKTGISTTSGNSATGLAEGSNLVSSKIPTSGDNATSVVPNYRLSLSGTTTVYLKINAGYSVATPQYTCRLSARRVR